MSNKSNNLTTDKQEERNNMLANLLDNININNLGQFYPKDESVLKKKVDKLNYRFYLETEKILKTESEKCYDHLFMILFKQITLYIQEIERLNIVLREKTECEKINKDKCDDIFRKEKEYNSMQMLINNLRATNKNLEKRLNEKIIAEEKMKNEMVSLERQIKFYKEKMQIELIIKKSQEMNKNRVTKRNLECESKENADTNIETSLLNDDISKTYKKRNNSENDNTSGSTKFGKSLGLVNNESKRESTKSNNLPKNIVIDLKSSFNKKITPRSDLKATIKKPLITSPKDLKIIKSIKQATGRKGNNLNKLDDASTPTCAKFLTLEINSINNSNINFNLDNSSLNELILSSYNIFDEEYQELVLLEELLIKGKQGYEIEAGRRCESVEICDTGNNISDVEDGYKSSNSVFSDTVGLNFAKSKRRIEKGITAVTIDLRKSQKKLKCFKMNKV
jgi:hypothetical protein